MVMVPSRGIVKELENSEPVQKMLSKISAIGKWNIVKMMKYLNLGGEESQYQSHLWFAYAFTSKETRSQLQ